MERGFAARRREERRGEERALRPLRGRAQGAPQEPLARERRAGREVAVAKKGLTRIEKTRQRREILVYDMEWYPAQAKPGMGTVKIPVRPDRDDIGLRLVGFYDGQRYQKFTRIDDFFNEVFQAKYAGAWIYAHYGGMADMTFMLEHIVTEKGQDSGWTVDASFSGSSAIIVTVKRGELEWNFIDSFWLLRDKLESLGKSIGEKKLSDSFECSHFPACGHIDLFDDHYRTKGNGTCAEFHEHDFRLDRHRQFVCTKCGEHRPKSKCVFWAPMDKLITYNEQDCKILYKAIKEFENVLWDLGGELQMTIASCAMRLFRRRYLGADITTSPEINEIARKAYTSSRVEVFQNMAPSVRYLDALEKAGIRECPKRCFSRWRSEGLPGAEDFEAWAKGPVQSLAPLCPQCIAYASRARAHYMDINSSFPFSMTFPCPGNVKRQRLPRGPHGKVRLPKKEGDIYLAHVAIRVPPMYLPPLPYRHENRVFFPHGTWSGWFSNIDLDLLERVGGEILEVFRVIEFHPQTFLRDYATDIYEKRKAAKAKGDDYRALILKFLLNSLYGKFGEKVDKKSMMLFPDSTDCPHTPKHRHDGFPNCCDNARAGGECNLCIEQLFPGCYIVSNQVEIAHEWVPIAVHITATSRRNLYNFLEEAQSDVYYCDSITGDRTVVIRSPEGRIVIEPVEDIFQDFAESMGVECHRGREYAVIPPGWEALAADRLGRSGWFPLLRVMAHETLKETVAIDGPHGATETTIDHGIMVRCDGEEAYREVSPDEFLGEGHRFVHLTPPEVDKRPVSSVRLRQIERLIADRGVVSQEVYHLPADSMRRLWASLRDGRSAFHASHVVIAQLSYALASCGIEHYFDGDCTLIDGSYQGDPGAYRSVRSRGPRTRPKPFEGDAISRVYDLEVEGAHTFVDGMGRVLLHNTDSCITTCDLPSDELTLGALKLEEDIWDGEFVAPKIYAAKVASGKAAGEHIVKAKGFSRMNYEKFVELKEGERIQIARATRITELYRKGGLPDASLMPEEKVVEKRLVQKMLPKRCALPNGQTRPWSLEEIEGNYMILDVDIPPNPIVIRK